MNNNLKFIIYFFVTIITSCSYRKDGNLRLSTSSIDVGEIDQYDTINVNFSVINDTRDKIKIFSIQSECGCISESIEDSIIKPYDSLKIWLKYIPAISSDSGLTKKSITITSTDSNPFLTLTLTSNVLK